MEATGAAGTSFFPNIVDVEWKLEVLSNTSGSGADNLQYMVVLKTDKGNDVTFTCDTLELHDLVYKLKDLVRHVENVKNELI